MRDGNNVLDKEIPPTHSRNLFGAGLYIDPVTGEAQEVTATIQAQVIDLTARTHANRWVADQTDRPARNGL